jgi:hypothetical protein
MKTAPKKMNTLTEKEIQERLYGFYRSSDMVGAPKRKEPAEKPVAAAPLTGSSPAGSSVGLSFIPKPETQKPSDLFAFSPKTSGTAVLNKPTSPFVSSFPPASESLSTIKKTSLETWEELRKGFLNFLSTLPKLPIRYFLIGFLGLALIAGVVSMFSFKKAPSISEDIPAVQAPVQKTVKVKLEKKAPLSAAVQTPLPAGVPGPELEGTGSAAPTGEKFYTVQLCLSDNLEATQVLLEKLKARGYEAYAKKIKGTRGNLLYQTFVGKYPNSSDAQSTLKQLRSDADFKMYDDSLVRVGS